ncbi:unnamed protein product [Effrenium voratum]|uniref:EF-hand domain-containing protein n=1 Tax=Effrenium voratum TaxID=2562239 RepID=A0AA36HZM7_9DINO|nr:unnamed protein product [Effrenium voratum]CAJ1378326.1 unnamed protein product [Effrenium voratum]CAJ1425528.1 unnamed protein product [Effrenium voratum]
MDRRSPIASFAMHAAQYLSSSLARSFFRHGINCCNLPIRRTRKYILGLELRKSFFPSGAFGFCGAASAPWPAQDMKTVQGLVLCAALFRSAANPLIQIPPHIQAMELSTPKPVTAAQMQEFKQDFVDVDFNKDDQMDAQEVRAHFKGGISDVELYQFFLDSDTDRSGDVSLQEYVDYAAMLG